jgi:hypothetical protein
MSDNPPDGVQVAEIYERYKHSIAHESESSKSYNNTIVLIGFGSFFAIWLQIGDKLSDNSQLWSAVLIIFSLSMYLVSTIANMLIQAKLINDFSKVMEYQDDPSAFFEKINETNDHLRQAQAFVNRYVWLPTFGLSVLSGLAGVILLGCNAFSVALGYTGWPR